MTAPVAELAGCASAAVLVAYGLCDASRRLARAVRRLPRAAPALGEGFTFTLAWWIAVGVPRLRHRPRGGQHCVRHAPAAAIVAAPAPVILPRSSQPSASEITVFDGRFGELRVRPFLEHEHTWSDRRWE